MGATIYLSGEIVLDIVFKNGKVINALAGGSMLNTAVSLARAGEKVSFIGSLGSDPSGKLIHHFLENNHIDTTYLRRLPESCPTPVTLAFLDEKNDASYTFYKQLKPPGLPNTAKAKLGPGDILMLGSFYSIDPANKPNIQYLLDQQRSQSCLMYYDLNFRKNHQHMLPEVLPDILRNIRAASIVKGSVEDYLTVFQCNEISDLRFIVPELQEKVVIITDGASAVQCYYRELSIYLPVTAIETVSTIGAGDSFNAGFIHGLSKLNQKLEHILPPQWEGCLRKGMDFAAAVCQSTENYIS